MYKTKNHSKIGEAQVMTQYENTLKIKDNHHSCAKLKTYHFSGKEYKITVNHGNNEGETTYTLNSLEKFRKTLSDLRKQYWTHDMESEMRRYILESLDDPNEYDKSDTVWENIWRFAEIADVEVFTPKYYVHLSRAPFDITIVTPDASITVQ